ncbi:hypothetical protein P7C73_g3665, partial [Tremellales sp. Uapishka_1]
MSTSPSLRRSTTQLTSLEDPSQNTTANTGQPQDRPTPEYIKTLLAQLLDLPDRYPPGTARLSVCSATGARQPDKQSIPVVGEVEKLSVRPPEDHSLPPAHPARHASPAATPPETLPLPRQEVDSISALAGSPPNEVEIEIEATWSSGDSPSHDTHQPSPVPAASAAISLAKEELADLDRGWERFQEAYGKMNAAMQDAFPELQAQITACASSADTSPPPSPSPTRTDQEIREETRQLRRQNQSLIDELAQANRRGDEARLLAERLEKIQGHMKEMAAEKTQREKRELGMTAQYLVLEDKYKATEKLLKSVSSGVGGHTTKSRWLQSLDPLRNKLLRLYFSMEKAGWRFDPELLKDGLGGGRAPIVLCQRTEKLIETAGKEFAAKVSRQVAKFCQLVHDGWQPRVMTLQLFLDIVGGRGLPSFSVDVTKHVRLYGNLDLCRFVFIGTIADDGYSLLAEQFQVENDGSHKLHFARSTPSFDDDPFCTLGVTRLLPVGCMYKYSAAEWRRLVRPSTPIPPALNHRHPVQASPPGLALQDKARSRRPTPPASHHAESTKRPLADEPNNTPVAPSPHSVHQPSNGSLLDQWIASQQPSTPRSPHIARQVATVSEAPHLLPTVRDHLVIPIDLTVDGSPGGSPPESDEGKPSVELPHSAVRYIKRPPVYDLSPSPPPARVIGEKIHGFTIRNARLGEKRKTEVSG